MKSKKRAYLDVNLPREWESFLNEALEDPEIAMRLKVKNYQKTYSSLGKWIIENFLVENTSYRYEHFNTLENHMKIYDKKLGRTIEVFRKGKELRCMECNKSKCPHVDFANKILGGEMP